MNIFHILKLIPHLLRADEHYILTVHKGGCMSDANMNTLLLVTLTDTFIEDHIGGEMLINEAKEILNN